MKPIVINTGHVNIPIKNHLGEDLGTISINPNDFNIIHRSSDGFDQISKLEKEITELFDPEHVDISDKLVKAKIKEIDDRIKQIVDFIFDSNVSKTVFKNTSCITMINTGKEVKPFVLVLLDALMPTIKEIVNKNSVIDRDKVNKVKGKYIP